MLINNHVKMLHQCNIWWVTAIWIKPSGRKGLWSLFLHLSVLEKNNLAESVTFFPMFLLR